MGNTEDDWWTDDAAARRALESRAQAAEATIAAVRQAIAYEMLHVVSDAARRALERVQASLAPAASANAAREGEKQ